MPGLTLGWCSDAVAVRTSIAAFWLAGRRSARSPTVVGEAPQRRLEQRLLILRRDGRAADREQPVPHLAGRARSSHCSGRGRMPQIIVTIDDRTEETRPGNDHPSRLLRSRPGGDDQRHRGDRRPCRSHRPSAERPGMRGRGQLIQHPARRQAFLYRGSGSRLKVRSCHKLMITRRLPQDGGTGPRIWQGF